MIRFSKQYAKAIRPFFQKLGQKILKAFDETKLALPKKMDDLLDVEKLQVQIAKQAETINRNGIYIGGSLDRKLSGIIKTHWSPTEKAISDYTKRHFGPKHYEDIVNTTRRKFENAIATSIAKKETRAEMRARIVKQTKILSKSGVDRIATTESTKLFGAGGQAFREVNEVTHKQWITSFVRSRDTHVDADGQTVKNDELFRVGGDSMEWPGSGSLAEENCNCACAAVGVMKKEK